MIFYLVNGRFYFAERQKFLQIPNSEVRNLYFIIILLLFFIFLLPRCFGLVFSPPSFLMSPKPTEDSSFHGTDCGLNKDLNNLFLFYFIFEKINFYFIFTDVQTLKTILYSFIYILDVCLYFCCYEIILSSSNFWWICYNKFTFFHCFPLRNFGRLHQNLILYHKLQRYRYVCNHFLRLFGGFIKVICLYLLISKTEILDK